LKYLDIGRALNTMNNALSTDNFNQVELFSSVLLTYIYLCNSQTTLGCGSYIFMTSSSCFMSDHFLSEIFFFRFFTETPHFPSCHEMIITSSFSNISSWFITVSTCLLSVTCWIKWQHIHRGSYDKCVNFDKLILSGCFHVT
jgi:hypothetical protein